MIDFHGFPRIAAVSPRADGRRQDLARGIENHHPGHATYIGGPETSGDFLTVRHAHRVELEVDEIARQDGFVFAQELRQNFAPAAIGIADVQQDPFILVGCLPQGCSQQVFGVNGFRLPLF
jgi:hypothetical protein